MNNCKMCLVVESYDCYVPEDTWSYVRCISDNGCL